MVAVVATTTELEITVRKLISVGSFWEQSLELALSSSSQKSSAYSQAMEITTIEVSWVSAKKTLLITKHTQKTRIGNDETGISDMMNRFDDFLAQHNVDSNACMQKAICHFVRSSDYHQNVGTADQIEAMISTLSQ